MSKVCRDWYDNLTEEELEEFELECDRRNANEMS